MAVEGLSQIVSVAEALRRLQQSDFAGAERVLTALLAGTGGADPQAVYWTGVARLKLGRLAEAAEAFALARRSAPLQARPAFGHGEALSALGRDPEAVEAYETAVRLDPAFAEARYELGAALHRLGELEKAQSTLGELLARMPDHVPARLALGGVLIDAKRPGEAEPVLRQGLAMAPPGLLKAAFHTNLGLALRRQRKDDEALENYESARLLHPDQPGLAVHRAAALQNLGRHGEALAVYETALATDPADPELHHRTNELLYRLNRRDAYLKSYDAAPPSRALLLGKASLLAQEKRGAESFSIYRQLLARDGGDRAALLGAANALNAMKQPQDALALLEPVLGDDRALLVRAAESALLAGDPQKAENFCRRALGLAPYDQLGLANLSLAWRMMADAREDVLNGYDRHVRIFDLEPPEGFSRMEDFNAELCAVLDRLHPNTREHIDQSLRGGTQTPDHLFKAGHKLVGRLERRIAEALQDYIQGLKGPQDHPLVSRRAASFDYAGSWSSRLTNCGFHVNHIHPAGWISSCYYVRLPKVVEDEGARQGWIKFGEPALDLQFSDPVRRAIQPVPGRLVLFPSYMWHGTNPFEDEAVRTTIAFDVVPKS